MEPDTCVEIRGVVDSTPYVTSTHEVLEEGRVLLEIPNIGDKEKRLPTNKPYYLRFFSSKGVYRFTTVMCGYFSKGGQDYMLFQTSDDGEKIANRQSFRLNCSQKVKFQIEDDGYVGPEQEGSIRDISAGGIRLKTVDELETRQTLNLDMSIISPDFNLAGIILAKNSINEAARFSLAESLFGKNMAKQSENAKTKYLWQYGIAFIGATDEEIERVIMHIHNEQQFKTKKERQEET
jgi:c-di-GMP-binding flagellar brake protein YcgR